MKFYCFPKKQTYCSIYSSYSVSKTRLFSNFVLQTSPKNSFPFRIRKTYLGHLFSNFATIDLDVPNPNSEYAGIRKTNKLILVEMENKIPKCVWKKNESNIWEKEKFLGYQIISEFSIKEFNYKKRLIEKALSEHWEELNESTSNIHGDFTHFNILYDEKSEIHLIDKKTVENSKLYDFFYFYSYFKHSINRDLSITKNEKEKMIDVIILLLREICVYDNKTAFEIDFNNIRIISDNGITKNDQKTYLNEFYQIFNI